MGFVNGRGRRAPVHRRQPTGIAMGQDIDASAPLGLAQCANNLDTMFADAAVDLHVFIIDFYRPRIGCRFSVRCGYR